MKAKALAAVVFAGLCVPTAAQATTYCVTHTDPCPAGQVAKPSLQSALNAAAVDLPGPNTVMIGPGTFSGLSTGFTYTASGAPPVAIAGSSPGTTILTADSGAPAVLHLDRPRATVSGVTIALNGATDAGLVLGDRTAATLTTVIGTGNLSDSVGVALSDGATFESGAVTMPDSSLAAVEQMHGSGGLVRLARLAGGLGVTTTPAASASIALRDVTISGADGVALANRGATVQLDESLAFVHNPGAVALRAADGTVRADGLTLVASGDGAAAGSVVNTVAGGAALSLQDSIVSGFASGFTRTVQAAGTNADLTVRHDDVTLGADSGAAGAVTIDHNIDADPAFVSASTGNYHLRADSPAIDAGGSCDSACALIPDLSGHNLPVDGDGDGQATRDLGAYEYGRTPPTVSVTVPPTVAQVGQSLTFDASGTYDTDPGDTLHFEWSFDDGQTVLGAKVAHAFTEIGHHSATVTVTDSAGVSASRRVTTVIVGSQGHSTPEAPVKRPSISRARFVPNRFAVASATARVAKHGAGTTSVLGTHLSLRTSAAGSLTIALERRLSGHVSGGHCRAGAGRGRSCTVFESAGVVTRANLAAGTVSLAFTGRVGTRALAPGSYIASLILVDATGTRSRPAVAAFTIVARAKRK